MRKDMLPNFLRIQHLTITLANDVSLAQEFSAKREEELAKIQDSYQKGLQHFKENNFKLAEEEFAEVLKPTLKRSSKQSLYVKIEDSKSELLDSMYHLGKIYLAEKDYNENHAKAIAIFQYCEAFAQKYDIAKVV